MPSDKKHLELKRRTNEFLFAEHKGHFFASALRWERSLPEEELLDRMAHIQLEAWRAHRKLAYDQMKSPVDLSAIQQRNLLEFHDPIGPTKEYFVSPDDSVSSSNWARRLITRTIELNGRGALQKLAEARKDAVSSKDSLPTGIREFASKVLNFATTGDAKVPWQVKDKDHRIEIRVNLFPDEVFFTLLFNGKNLGDFNDWPKHWRRPT